jgi:predicted MPP superfamily phosphohydrolase
VLRVVQLSDVHLREIGRHEARIAEIVHALRPELLVLTGDAIDRAGSLTHLATFLSLLPAAPARVSILGNWEHWGGVDLVRLAAVYERAGWTLLRNASTTVPVGDAELLVTGLDDLVGGKPDVSAALAPARPCPNHLLLAHCPLHRDAFAASALVSRDGTTADFDPALRTPQLMLAGHTHGGQVALGGWAPMRPPGSGRYVAGWYRDAATALYVSRGLGTSVVPVRFGAPPEIAVFDWRLVV